MPLDYETQIQNILHSTDLTPEMQKTLQEWEKTLHRIKVTTKLNYLSTIKAFGKYLRQNGKRRYEDAEKRDVDSYLVNINKSYNRVVTLVKRLYKNIGMTGIVEHLKSKQEEIRPIPPSELLSPDEVVGLAGATGHPMYKAIILGLYEASARVDVEFLRLKVGDVVFSSVRDRDENHTLIATLHFGNSKGDVKKEPVTLSMFAGELKAWTEVHPEKDNSQAWLWPSEVDPTKHVAYNTIWHVLRKAKERTGIRKKVNPHWLRHSGLSFCANELNYNEQLLMWRAGWKNTGMAKRYIHSGGDLERRAYLERQGYLVEEKRKDIPKAKPCPHCNHLNPYTNNACDLCGMPLDLEQYQMVLQSRRHPEDIAKIEVLSEKVERLEMVIKALAKAAQPELEKQAETLLKERSKDEALQEMGALKPPKGKLKLPEKKPQS